MFAILVAGQTNQGFHAHVGNYNRTLTSSPMTDFEWKNNQNCDSGLEKTDEYTQSPGYSCDNVIVNKQKYSRDAFEVSVFFSDSYDAVTQGQVVLTKFAYCVH